MKNYSFTIIYVLIGILFIAIFAQINIDLPGGIPISGQSFAVLLTAYILGRKWGTIAVFGYVLLGAIGLPIFADAKAGIEVLKGGSGGFLIGFIVAAFVVGWLAELNWRKSFVKSLLVMLLGTAIILTFGIGKLTLDYSFPQALEWGFYPFLWGALVKIVVGAAILPLKYKYL